MSTADVHTIMESLRQTSMAMFDFDDPDTNPPLINWSGDLDDGIQLIEDLMTLIRKLGAEVEVSTSWDDSSGRHFEPRVSGFDSHGGTELTEDEYALLTAIQANRA